MKTSVLGGVVLGGAVVATLAVTPQASALSTMNGSVPFGALSATIDTGSLATGNVITPFTFVANQVIVTPVSGTGDFFLAAPAFTLVTTSNIDLIAQTFTFSDPAFGTWVTTSISNIQRPTDILSFEIFGNYTPGTLYPGFLAGPAEIVVSLTQAGGAGKAISWSATLVSPPITSNIPEPMTAGLGLLSLGALGAFATRRRQA